jgi:hypothetical protein
MKDKTPHKRATLPVLRVHEAVGLEGQIARRAQELPD